MSPTELCWGIFRKITEIVFDPSELADELLAHLLAHVACPLQQVKQDQSCLSWQLCMAVEELECGKRGGITAGHCW